MAGTGSAPERPPTVKGAGRQRLDWSHAHPSSSSSLLGQRHWAESSWPEELKTSSSLSSSERPPAHAMEPSSRQPVPPRRRRRRRPPPGPAGAGASAGGPPAAVGRGPWGAEERPTGRDGPAAPSSRRRIPPSRRSLRPFKAEGTDAPPLTVDGPFGLFGCRGPAYVGSGSSFSWTTIELAVQLVSAIPRSSSRSGTPASMSTWPRTTRLDHVGRGIPFDDHLAGGHLLFCHFSPFRPVEPGEFGRFWSPASTQGPDRLDGLLLVHPGVERRGGRAGMAH